MGCTACAAAALAPPGWAQRWSMPPRFARPDSDSEEGGLWAIMDREEARLRQSRFLLEDAALVDYVRRIACRLAGEHCPDVRVYLVRTPYFNATMAPNGMMLVWSGLLLRMTSEAQLAAVLGHEIGHYLARHSLERMRDARTRAAASQFVGLALGAAGAGNVNLFAQLALIAGQYAYSREHEREADRIGLELMARAGYAPGEAARVWGELLEERQGGIRAGDGDDGSGGGILFATHPPAEERQKALREAAPALAPPGGGRLGTQAHREALTRVRGQFLADELKRRRFGESQVLLERLARAYPGDGQLGYYRGEFHRLRGEQGDAARALDAYRAAAGMPGAPPEVHRSLGLVARGQGRAEESARALRRYLELRPDAGDAAMIRALLEAP